MGKLRSALMYPTRRDIVQSTDIACKLAGVAAITFRREFRDTRKATAKYLSATSGLVNLKILTDEQVTAGKSIEATNNAAERLHGASTEFLRTHGAISLEHYTAPGTSQVNNDSGRTHTLLVLGKIEILKKWRRGGGQMGSKFDLPSELQETLIIHAKEFAPTHKKRTKKWLAVQFEARRRAEEITLKKTKELQGGKHCPNLFLSNTTLPVVGKMVLSKKKKGNDR